MKPIQIIDKVESEVEKAITKINHMYQIEENDENKEQLMNALEDHISYGIFLRELKENLSNGISVEKEYFGKQMLNICQSCSTISKMYETGK